MVSMHSTARLLHRVTPSKRIIFPAMLLAILWMPQARAKDEADPIGIVPLLSARCLECHSGDEPQGELDLSHIAGLKRGGASGEIVDSANWDKSLLWQYISNDSMPPKKKLSAEEKEKIRQWLQAGASLPDKPIDRMRFTSDYRAGYDWWSLQPLASPAIPTIAEPGWSENPIDAFVAHRLVEHGLTHNAPATPRSLIKRVYYDLTGLPPSYQQIEAFEKNPSQDTYRAIVERLLDSPQYGERWGRHWLDVVRFGESDGFERNFPRKTIWPYRDWVIRSLNKDMPYDRFVQMQLVGDLIDPSESGIAASAFLVCGVHNTVVGSSDRMKRIAKQDELEEMIGTISQTFLGLTAQCARCHDHKFDPISSQTYYRLTSAMQGVEHGERDVAQHEVLEKIDALEAQRRQLDRRLDEIHAIARRALHSEPSQAEVAAHTFPDPLAAWNFERSADACVGTLHATPRGKARVEAGALVLDGESYLETDRIPADIEAKTLMARVAFDGLDQSGGAAISLQTPGGEVFDAIVFAERETRQWFAGSNNFSRSQSFHAPQENAAPDQSVHVAIRYDRDGNVQAFRNGKPYGTPYRSTVQRFQQGNAQVLIGLRHAPAGGNRLLKGKVYEAAIYDQALTDEAIASIAQNSVYGLSESQIDGALSDAMRKERTQLREALMELNAQIQSLRPSGHRKIYSIVPSPSAAVSYVLKRGDVYAEGEAVAAGGIDAIGHAAADFGLAPNAPEAERRMKFSQWIVDRNNPLLSRVIVNRLWHYHFGTGIVDTPNDFGFNGGRPTHLELLDWLAKELIAHDFQLKHMHRLMVLSKTYQQASTANPVGMERDASDRWMWRYPVRRLDAESIRDTMLTVSGQLNQNMGGPGFVDVDVQENNGTTFYAPIDVRGPEFFRRTVYRFNPRCERNPILDTFDCPDPSATAPRRVTTTTPLQALSLLNNAFVLDMSEAITNKVQGQVDAMKNTGSSSDSVKFLFRAILLRSPTPQERDKCVELVEAHGLSALARALFNSNEFLVLD